MRMFIDQSGKVEQTNKNTILCLANGHWDAVVIPSSVKRQLLEVFRRNGQIRNFVLFAFIAGLLILLKRNLKIGSVLIDREYFGKEPIIKRFLIEGFRKEKQVPRITFGHLGKQARAHHIAHDVATGEIKAKKIVTFDELFEALKKTEVGKRLKNA